MTDLRRVAVACAFAVFLAACVGTTDGTVLVWDGV